MAAARSARRPLESGPGHWDGDLVIGLGAFAVGMLVERSTRFAMLLRLPLIGHGEPARQERARTRGHGAEAVRDAIVAAITSLPERLRRSLTWGPGLGDGPTRSAAG